MLLKPAAAAALPRLAMGSRLGASAFSFTGPASLGQVRSASPCEGFVPSSQLTRGSVVV